MEIRRTQIQMVKFKFELFGMGKSKICKRSNSNGI